MPGRVASTPFVSCIIRNAILAALLHGNMSTARPSWQVCVCHEDDRNPGVKAFSGREGGVSSDCEHPPTTRQGLLQDWKGPRPLMVLRGEGKGSQPLWGLFQLQDSGTCPRLSQQRIHKGCAEACSCTPGALRGGAEQPSLPMSGAFWSERWTTHEIRILCNAQCCKEGRVLQRKEIGRACMNYGGDGWSFYVNK